LAEQGKVGSRERHAAREGGQSLAQVGSLNFGAMVLHPDGRRAFGSVTRHGRSPDRGRGKSQCRGIHGSEPDDRQVGNLACALGATRDAVPPRDEPAAFELRRERSDSVAVRGCRRSMGKAGTVPGLRSRSGDVRGESQTRTWSVSAHQQCGRPIPGIVAWEGKMRLHHFGCAVEST
jgi:hypothetical protein